MAELSWLEMLVLARLLNDNLVYHDGQYVFLADLLIGLRRAILKSHQRFMP
jgi:hypothetical protein